MAGCAFRLLLIPTLILLSSFAGRAHASGEELSAVPTSAAAAPPATPVLSTPAPYTAEQLEKVTAEVYRLLQVMSQAPTGQRLIDRAIQVWSLKDSKELRRKITLGLVSRTDAVLTRHFNPVTGKEMRERNVTITIKAAQSLGERVLDLAHELTHAVAEPSWDPYDPELTPGKYIQASLEATGGEIEAVYFECAVAQELQDAGTNLSRRCDRYIEKTQDSKRIVNRDLVRLDFYRVGKWRDDVLKKLGAESTLFPHLSPKSPELYSATGGAPYPVSLIREYEELNKIACENARRRARTRAGRSPASAALLSGRCQVVDDQNSLAHQNVAPSQPLEGSKSR